MEAAIANRMHLRLGHPNLQPIGSTAESGQSVLDAPLLGILKPRARDLAGYGLLQLVVQLSIVVLFVLAVFAVDPVRASYSMSCQHPG